MKRYLAKLPPHLSRILLGVWFIGMALGVADSPVKVSFTGYRQLLAIILIASGVFTVLGRFALLGGQMVVGIILILAGLGQLFDLVTFPVWLVYVMVGISLITER